jgi:hypothetical protein
MTHNDYSRLRGDIVVWSISLAIWLFAGWAHAQGDGLAPPVRLIPMKLPDLEAVIVHDLRQFGSDGVLRITRYQERLVRRGERVWTERVLPPGTQPGEPVHERGRGHHLDFARVARLLRRRDAGQTSLTYVDLVHERVIAVPEPEWDNVAFDGSWDRAAMLVTEAELGQLRPIERSVPAPELMWRGIQTQGHFIHVLWDPIAGIARRIESGSVDGSDFRTLEVSLHLGGERSAPWDQTTGFEQKSYTDLLD